MGAARIGVAGAGTMGAGIARLAAAAGFETHLHDPAADALEQARARIAERDPEAGGRLQPADELDALAPCDLVIEAAPEELELKRDLLATLAELCGPKAVLATNTSSLSVTAIAAGVPEPGRVVGMHFFNPPAKMRLVEIVAGERSDPAALGLARSVARRMGREPIDAADSIGFLANRLARPFTLEALRMLGERIATVERIDEICRVHGGFRMGPFELIDLVGVDVNLAVARSFWEQSFHEPRWQPHPIQQRMVDSGRLGRKAGRGFYEYGNGPHRPDDPESAPDRVPAGELIDARGLEGAVLGRILAQIVNESHFAVAEGVGSEADADKAMRLGFNWPKGPFEWTAELGVGRVLVILEELWQRHRRERYRPSALLVERAAS
jgi:3-hydroxybutyryl-CoA dehydrogenase